MVRNLQLEHTSLQGELSEAKDQVQTVEMDKVKLEHKCEVREETVDIYKSKNYPSELKFMAWFETVLYSRLVSMMSDIWFFPKIMLEILWMLHLTMLKWESTWWRVIRSLFCFDIV